MTSTERLHLEPIDLPAAEPAAPDGTELDHVPPADDPWPWRVPGRLWQHVLALTLLLCALVPMLDNGHIVSADEGAVLSQMEILRSTGGWGLENPLAGIDDEGRWFGIDISDQHEGRFFPYGKHAAYPAAMSPLYETGGQRLVLLASALGTAATAALAALLARRMAPNLDVPTLWVVGVLSPLFFDSFWVIAHSIGAAFAVGAVLATAAALERRRPAWLAVAGVAVAGATLFRSEGMLLGLALALACGGLALRRRDLLAAVAAVVSGAAASAAWWVDGRMYSSIVGTTISPFTINDRSPSWIEGRLRGAWASVLRPQLLASTPAGALFLVSAICVVLAAAYLRLRPAEVRLIRGAAIVAAACSLATLALPKAPVPGLLLAFPLLPAGLILLRRDALASPTARLATTTGGLFALAVLATQYPVGGSMEWGGRFFHVGLPLVVPVLLLAVAGARRWVDATTGRIALGSLAIASVVLLVASVGTVVRIHTITGELVDGIVAMTDRTDDDHPVVVSTMEAVGRLSWEQAVHARYLRVTERDDLPTVARRLDAAEVDRFVLATAFHHADRHRLTGYRVLDVERVGQWRLTLMERSA